MSSARKKTPGASARGGKNKAPKAGKAKGGTAARKGGKTARSTSGASAPGAGHGQYSQLGLMEIVQRRFLNDVFDQAQAAYSGWKILIVDDPSMRVISSAVGMYDIMERNVSLVEALDKKRAPFKDMAAMYILSPTKDSVEKLILDFEDKNKLLYGDSVFVYFLGPIPKHLVDMIMKCKHLIKRLKALSEINADYLVKEDRAYQLEVKADYNDFFSRRSASREAENAISSKLVTLCASLNEYPYIRYKESSGLTSSLARTFKTKMDEFVGANPDWWYHGSGNSGKQSTELERSTLLLLDRSMDCLTPLMHDFTYQPMVQDLLTVDGNKITVDVEGADNPDDMDKKDVLLNDKDKLWVELRGLHIAQVIEVLSTRISETVNSGSGNALSGSGKDVSLSELASALKALPEYREVMAKLSQHMHMSRECMDSFTKMGLLDLSDLEQTLGTGEDEDGDKADTDELVGMVEDALLRMHDSTSRLRLILIALLAKNKIGRSGRDRMLRAAKLDRDQMLAMENLLKISGSGGKYSPEKKKKSKGTGLFGSKKNKEDSDDENAYASSRYTPVMKNILNELVANSLSLDEFPSVVPMPASTISSSKTDKTSARTARKKKGATDKWSTVGGSKKSTNQDITFSGSRSLVFMVGGMSYSELRVASKIMQKSSREIIIGSTDFISASDFIKKLDSV